MKKCQKCGYDNTDVMNFCLECGDSLINEPRMVVPLETVNMQTGEKPSEQVTEDYEKETVVNNFALRGQSVQTIQQPKPQGNNSKLLLAIGGGLVALILLVFTGAAGIAFLAWQSQSEKPKSKPLVSIPKKSPESSPEIYPEETPEETPKEEPEPEEKPEEEPEETPQPTPITNPTPEDDIITFPTPKVPTKRATYRVNAKSGWQLSNIKTVPRENFRVRVSGRINLDGIKNRVSARGVSGHKNRRIFKQFRTGALLMRTHYPNGKHSNIQPVSAGQYWQNYPNETGKIEFLVNDNAADYNSGNFKIRFEMINVPRR